MFVFYLKYFLGNDDSHDRSICSSNSSSNGMNSQNLPSTERCEKQISEIVQIKATTDESNIVIHKNIISDSKLPFLFLLYHLLF